MLPTKQVYLPLSNGNVERHTCIAPFIGILCKMHNKLVQPGQGRGARLSLPSGLGCISDAHTKKAGPGNVHKRMYVFMVFFGACNRKAYESHTVKPRG